MNHATSTDCGGGEGDLMTETGGGDQRGLAGSQGRVVF
jgi:hypothetical protein